MQVKLLSITSSENPQQFLVEVSVGDQVQTFLIQSKPLKAGDNIGTLIKINSEMLRFLRFEHDLNTPVLKAVGKFQDSEPLVFPIVLGNLAI